MRAQTTDQFCLTGSEEGELKGKVHFTSTEKRVKQ